MDSRESDSTSTPDSSERTTSVPARESPPQAEARPAAEPQPVTGEDQPAEIWADEQGPVAEGQLESLSLSGLLSGLTACGLMFIWWKFPGLSTGWPTAALILYGLAVVGLLGWSVFQSIPRNEAAPSAKKAAVRRERSPRMSRNRVRLPRPGLAYLAMMIVMFLGAMLGRSNVLMLVFSLMAGPFIVNGWVTYSMLKHLKLRRTVSRQMMAGDQVSVTVEVINGKHVIPGWLIQVEDRITSLHEKLRAEVLFARIPARQSRSIVYVARLMRRGRYRFGPMQAFTRFPFGLIERGLAFVGERYESEILVFPRTGLLSTGWKQQMLAATELVERQEPRQGTWNDEFHRIREFRWGDNPRAIHWRTSARQNELMVREFQQNRDQDLVLLLDLYCPTRASALQQERVELAISFVATVALAHIRDSRHARSLLAVAGSMFQELEGDCGPLLQEPLLQCLALAESAPGPDLKRLIELAARRRSASARMILITTRPQETIDPILASSASSGHENGDGKGSAARATAMLPLTELAIVSTADPHFDSIFSLR